MREQRLRFAPTSWTTIRHRRERHAGCRRRRAPPAPAARRAPRRRRRTSSATTASAVRKQDAGDRHHAASTIAAVRSASSANSVVGHDVRRHEVDGAADRPQQELAARAPAHSTSARNPARSVSTSNAQIIPRLPEIAHVGDGAPAAARAAVQRAAFARLRGDDVVVAKDVEHRERRATGERIAGVRMRVQERRARRRRRRTPRRRRRSTARTTTAGSRP